MKNVAIILSGCGVYDGAEIHEAVLTLLAVESNGAKYQCFAPDIDQLHVINHRTGEEMDETRNVLVEAARIARGEIKNVVELNAADYDALLIPGGFGAAKNLSSFAVKGVECDVQPDVLAALISFAEAAKPVGYICIAPAMIPLVYGANAVGTIGTDEQTAAAFNQMGGEHQICAVDQIAVDETNKVVSTPAYMLAGSVSEAASGINKLVEKVLSMA